MSFRGPVWRLAKRPIAAQRQYLVSLARHFRGASQGLHSTAACRYKRTCSEENAISTDFVVTKQSDGPPYSHEYDWSRNSRNKETILKDARPSLHPTREDPLARILQQHGHPPLQATDHAANLEKSLLEPVNVGFSFEPSDNGIHSQYDDWLPIARHSSESPEDVDQSTSSSREGQPAGLSSPKIHHGDQLKTPERAGNSTHKPHSDLKVEKDASPASVLPFWILDSANAIRSRKADLSYVDMRKWEAGQNHAIAAQGDHHAKAFKDYAGLRRLMTQYLTLRSELFRSDGCAAALDESLDKVFSPQALESLQKRGFGVEDVETWAWIIRSQSVKSAVDRWIFCSREARAQQRPQLPWFLLLQILRTPSISSYIFSRLLEETQSLIEAAFAKKQRIDSTMATVVVIRLIRHARLERPITLTRIASLAIQLLGPPSDASIQVLRRLGYVYNRLLSLLALPTSRSPFRSVVIQQKAQIQFLEHMNRSDPQIALNREGYRALVQVQLAHKKTPDERLWAQVKSPSWPPWRRDKLGIEANIEYAGSDSRALKVLRRMNEAGYTHEDWEKAAAVLAGRDTDKSPTIQTRGFSLQRPVSWLKEWLQFSSRKQQSKVADHGLWAARITATRTVKEGWAIFCAYVAECDEPTSAPYHAMLSKLLARKTRGHPESSEVPGDNRETYFEPMSPRDQTYVPREPPSVPAFYQQMPQHGIKPAGRTLQLLLDQAPDFSSGLQYIKDSAYDEVKKDVILHAEKYDAAFIQNIIQRLPGYLFASCLYLFIRYSLVSPTFRQPCTASTSYISPGLESQMIPADVYGITLLELSKTPYVPAWNVVLKGIIEQDYHMPLKNRADLVHSPLEKWKMVSRVVNLMKKHGVVPDFETMGAMARLGTHLCLRNPRATRSRGHCLVMIKEVFAETVAGMQRNTRHRLQLDNCITLSVPDAAQLTMYTTHLGTQQDFKGLMSLISWMHQQHDAIVKRQLETVNGEMWLRRCLSMCRTFLEGSWAEEQEGELHKVADADLEKAKKLLEVFGWPSDEEVAILHAGQQRLFDRLDYVLRNFEYTNGRQLDASDDGDMQ